MKGLELKIRFKDNNAYLTLDKSLTFEQVDMPDIARVKGFKTPAYWTVRVINYSELEKRIFCEIISYHVGDTNFNNYPHQLLDKLNDIEIVTFRNIDTEGLLRTLNGGDTAKSAFSDRHYYQSKPIVRQPFKQFINEIFFVPLKDVRFKLGGVSFDKKFKEYKQVIELTIPNDNIREEFDAVKNYFANVLNTKKIQVTANIEITDNEITSINVKSPEIDKIGKQIIDNVRLEYVKSTMKKKLNVEIDKSLFTMDDYFNTFAGEQFQSNTFYKNDKDFFEDLLQISNTKHYRHLRFLSSKHSHEIMKLRFVHKPFSFVFLIQGDKNYHIIWETFDTEEATYIWHIEKDIKVLKLTLQKIEDIINIIKVQGKTAYLNSADEPFRRIYHDYSELVDGFVKWKGELESILT